MTTRRITVLVTAALVVGASGAASAQGSPEPTADVSRRCASLASRGVVDVPHLAPCEAPAVMTAPGDTSAPTPGVCRAEAVPGSRCPRQVSRAGSFSSRVTGGTLLPGGGAIVRGMDYRKRAGWQLSALRPDGSPRWTTAHNGGGWVASAQVVDGGRGVIASGYTSTPSYKLVVRRYNTATGKVMWTASPRVGSSPESVGYDLALTPDGRTAIIAGYSHSKFEAVRPVVIALDVATGRVRWSREVPVGEGPGAAVYYVELSRDGQTVYAAGDTWDASPDPYVAALDTRSGRVRWTLRVEGATFESVYDAVLAADGVSLVLVGEAYLPTWNASKRLILSVDTETGEQQWRIESPAPANGQYWWVTGAVATRSTVTAVMTSNVLVYSGTGAHVWLRAGTVGGVIGIDPALGEVIWKTLPTPQVRGLPSDPVIAASPDGARVYIAGAEADRTVYAYAPSAGGGRHEASDLVVVAMDAKSGAVVWRSAYNASPDAPDGSAAGGIEVTGDGVHVFAATTPGPRYAAPGAYRWDTEGLWLRYDH